MGLSQKLCVDFIDDILVVRCTFNQHLRNLSLMFKCLRKAGLRLKPKKYCFGQAKVNYLSYTIFRSGLAPQSDKMTALCDFQD